MANRWPGSRARGDEMRPIVTGLNVTDLDHLALIAAEIAPHV
jgi:hypothetical protein